MANYATRHRKNHTALTIIIVVVVLIILIPVALILVLWVLITDTSRTDKFYDTGLTFTEIMDDMMFDMLTFQEDDEGNLYLRMSMTDDELSEAMHTILLDYMDSLGGIIDNYYVSMYDNKFDIAVEASIWIVETKVTISCTMDTVVNEEHPEDSYIFFSIDELIIGQLSGLRDIALDIVGLFIDLDDIASSLRDGGFSLYYDSENVAFTYKFSDLINDVLGNVDMGNASLYINSFIDTLIDNNLLYGGVNGNELVVSVNVTDFVSEARDDAIDFETVIGKVELLLREGIISGETEANNMLSYLLYGYYGVDDDVQSFIEGLDLSLIGLYSDEDKQNYVSEHDKYNSDINSVFEATIEGIDANEIMLEALNSEDLAVNLEIATISISDISSYLGSLSINGTAYSIFKDDQIRMLGVSNIMCYYDEERMVFTIGITINFSGYSIDIGIEYMVLNTENELRLYYLGNFMGSYTMNRDSINGYIGQIAESLSSSYFSLDEDYFVIDLNLNTDEVLGEYASYVNDGFMIYYDFTSDNIEISCSFSLNEDNIKEMVKTQIGSSLGQTMLETYEGLDEYFASRWRELMIAYLDEDEDVQCCYYQILRDYFANEYTG
ncbi:MAG: hypothetical protein LUC16_01385, partial [Coprobacillus sp.]|nr:hypothetical protein [Coprobacillus sp.]